MPRNPHQTLITLKTDHELVDYKADRRYKQSLPTNPIENEYETQFKPQETGTIRTPLHQATARTEAIIEAAKIRKNREQEIDAGPFTDEEKVELKLHIRAEFDAIIGSSRNKPEEKT